MLLREPGIGRIGGQLVLEEAGEVARGLEVGAGLGVGLERLLQGFALGGGQGLAEGVGGEVFGFHGGKFQVGRFKFSDGRVRRVLGRSISGGAPGGRGG